MCAARIDFGKLSWEETSPGARSKAVMRGGRRLRLVEFTEAFVEREWCTKAHAGYVVEGDLEVAFADRVENFTAGDGIFIGGEEGERHRARAASPVVRLVLFEDV
ncbi:MAG: phosrestin [Acidobacteriota bacterium]|nr:phosrestin [Acidobacteriota bacterium]